MEWNIDPQNRKAVHDSGLTLAFYSFGGELRELMPGHIPEQFGDREVMSLAEAACLAIARRCDLIVNRRRLHIQL